MDYSYDNRNENILCDFELSASPLAVVSVQRPGCIVKKTTKKAVFYDD